MGIIAISILAIAIAVKVNVLRLDLQSYGFMILACAILHLGFMYFYFDQFAMISHWYYVAVSFACLLSLIVGVRVGESLAGRVRWQWWRNSRSGEVLERLQPAILGFVLFISVLNVISYVRATGSYDITIGLRRYLSGENSANEMWATTGALRYGEGRGSEGGEGGVLSYLLSRFSMITYMLLGALKPTAFVFGAGSYLLSDLLALSVGYFSRTAVLIRAGILVFYCDARIRKLRPMAILVLMSGGLFVFLVLHLGRIGALSEPADVFSGKDSVAALESAAVGTFEPIGYAFKYYTAFGGNSAEENVGHLGGYIGAVVPRLFWTNKPYYAFEPDLTIKLTQQNIGGVNVVRTFSIVGEGLMVGGLWGVALISFLYASLTSFTLAFLGLRREFTVLRIYLLIVFTLGFRLSLFTIWTGTFILGLLPLAIAWLSLHFIVGQTASKRNA